MATACSFLSEDHFQCSICLDVFTEPVSIPCGHNFCKACLTRHWEGRGQCQCPLCNKKFDKGLKLCVNTGFRDVVQNFKEHHAIANNNSPAKPGQVLCDHCLDNKFQASKTCLVCLTSYCEMHLEPHRRVAALKRHKLTDPVHNLEDQTCKEHNRMLELFCRDDLTCICVLCTEHHAHNTVPLEEAYVEKSSQARKKNAEAQEIKRRGKRAQKKVKVAEQTKRKGKDEVMTNSRVSNQTETPATWWIPHHFSRDVSEGRFYREVQSEESTRWDLGVAREPLRGMRTFIPNPRNGNWVIRLGTDTNCNVLPAVPLHIFLIKKPERVLVIVDYDTGLVSFFDTDTMSMAYCFTGCEFNERIYLFYGPSPPEDDSWTLRLQRKFQRIKAWSQHGHISNPYFLLFSLCLLFLLLLLFK